MSRKIPLDLSFQFRGAFGFKFLICASMVSGTPTSGTDNILRSAYLEDKDLKTGGGVISSYFLEKGDYLKLDNLTLGYTFTPKSQIS